MAKGLQNFNFHIKKEIFISPGSDIVSGKLEVSEVKTTVIGETILISKKDTTTLGL
jgi:hypothetical protein